MSYTEQATVFTCDDCRLLGIITRPEVPADTGVIIVVGGPQYRAGSHRQFTLLARQLAEQGIASMRFDYRGMGDSEGDIRCFEEVNSDIKAAVDTFFEHHPKVGSVVLWGLCDAASAALYYAHTDSRVNGLVLLNPWAHTEAGASRARIKHYYLSRLMQRSFWAKLLSGKVRLKSSIGDLANSAQSVASATDKMASAPANPLHGSPGYIQRMLDDMNQFQGRILFILSGNDLVANEFKDLLSHDKKWKKACASTRISLKQLEKANHTFSTQTWREQVAQWTKDLIDSDR